MNHQQLQKHYPCQSCWYSEGGKCYQDETSFKRDKNGVSDKPAVVACEHHLNSKLVYLRAFSGILSERQKTILETYEWSDREKKKDWIVALSLLPTNAV